MLVKLVVIERSLAMLDPAGAVLRKACRFAREP